MEVTRTSSKKSESAFRAACSSFTPGCVVLFSGLTSLEFKIQATLNSRWTRSAIVVPGPDGNPVLLQSTSRPIAPDLKSGKLSTGAQLVAIPDVLANFDGYVGFRSIAPILPAQVGALAEFAREKVGTPFNFSPYYALRAARRRNGDGDGTKYYCTELVAAALQHAGILNAPPAGRCASNHVPGDFASDTEDLSLANGHTLIDGDTIRCRHSAI
jgi:hypothetical protein